MFKCSLGCRLVSKSLVALYEVWCTRSLIIMPLHCCPLKRSPASLHCSLSTPCLSTSFSPLQSVYSLPVHFLLPAAVCLLPFCPIPCLRCSLCTPCLSTSFSPLQSVYSLPIHFLLSAAVCLLPSCPIPCLRCSLSTPCLSTSFSPLQSVYSLPVHFLLSAAVSLLPPCPLLSVPPLPEHSKGITFEP